MVELPEHSARILEAVLGWAKAGCDIRGVALVGSVARGAARPDSDVDVVVLSTAPANFRNDRSWVDAIDWPIAGVRVAGWHDEDFGAVWSRHLRLTSGAEVDIGFAPLSWAHIAPLDMGTRRVVSDGCRVLHDPDGVLERLCRTVAS
jgi:uncharacterized protein